MGDKCAILDFGSDETFIHERCPRSCSLLSMCAWNPWNKPMHPCMACSRGIWVNPLLSNVCSDCAPHTAEEVLQQCACCHCWHLTRHVCHTCLYASMAGAWFQVVYFESELTPSEVGIHMLEEASSSFLPAIRTFIHFQHQLPDSVVRNASAPAILVSRDGGARD